MAGKINEELTELKEGSGPIVAMKKWMMDILDRFGFIGVVLLSAWPNAAFDLVGICCGTMLWPFWKFFGACCIGKAFVKVHFQSLFFIFLFRDGTEALISSLRIDAFFSTMSSWCNKFFSAQNKACVLLQNATVSIVATADKQADKIKAQADSQPRTISGEADPPKTFGFADLFGYFVFIVIA